MTIKKLVNTEQEYVDWVKETFLSERIGTKGIWRKEDLPKLEAFFKFSESREQRAMTPEESESFEYYRKCYEEYGEKASELQNILKSFDFEELVDYFVLKLDEPLGEDGEPLNQHEYNIDHVVFDREDCEPVSYPMVAVLHIDSGWDRVGDYKAFQLTFVEQKMFEE
jgi:hypothetical protein